MPVCGVLIYMFTFLAAAKSCPDTVSLQIHQDARAPRSDGEVVISCSITGITEDSFNYFAWLINGDIVYTYSQASNGSEYLADLITLEHHSFVSSSMESHLQFNISLIQGFDFTCKFNTSMGENCFVDKTLNFEEPNVTIALGQKLKYDNDNKAIFGVVTCGVDGSFGKPQICFSYRGSWGAPVKRLDQKFEIAPHNNNWFQATHKQLLLLPRIGYVQCHVYDGLGKYSVSTAIDNQISECNTNVSVRVIQRQLAPRMHGNVTIECVISGLTRSDMDYFAWFVEETNTPIYIFSDKHGINTTVENYKDRLISVTPEFTPHVMTFKLLLYANISDQNIYKCVAKMPTGEHCFDSKPVMFHDPKVIITSYAGSSLASDVPQFTHVTCCVDIAAGEPQIDIVNIEDRTDKLRNVEATEIKAHHFCQSVFVELLAVAHVARTFECTVTDSLGCYRVKMKIPISANIPVPDKIWEQVHYVGWCAFYVMLVVPIFLCIWIARRRESVDRYIYCTASMALTVDISFFMGFCFNWTGWFTFLFVYQISMAIGFVALILRWELVTKVDLITKSKLGLCTKLRWQNSVHLVAWALMIFLKVSLLVPFIIVTAIHGSGKTTEYVMWLLYSLGMASGFIISLAVIMKYRTQCHAVTHGPVAELENEAVPNLVDSKRPTDRLEIKAFEDMV